jgi:hypothetical protein
MTEDGKASVQRIRISLDELDCRFRDGGLNEYLKASHKKITSYKLIGNELEFVTVPSDGYSHYFMLCKCENSANHVLQATCDNIEVNKQYYVTVTKPDPTLFATYNTIALKIIENRSNTWYIVEYSADEN